MQISSVRKKSILRKVAYFIDAEYPENWSERSFWESYITVLSSGVSIIPYFLLSPYLTITSTQQNNPPQ